MLDDDLLERLSADLALHASFGSKRSGGAGDAATADWIAERLRRMGLAVSRSRFEIPHFEGKTACLTVGTGTTVQVFPQPVVVPTGPDGITAPLAAMRAAYEAPDVGGRIALVVLPFGRHAALSTPTIGPLVKAAASAGAKAIVIVTTGPTGEALALNCPAEMPLVTVPMAILAPKDSEPFFKAAREGKDATLILDGVQERRETTNTIATLERGSRWFVLSTPRTGWFDCVGERGTGTAAFLELIAWAIQSFPDISIAAVNSGAHEFNGEGMLRAVGLVPPPAEVKLWVHIGATLAARDCQEFRGRRRLLPSADPTRVLMAPEELHQTLADAFCGLSGLECPCPVFPVAGELPTIIEHGYRNAFAVLGIHRWFHSSEDTLDKVDARLLVPVVEAHTRAMESFLSMS